MLVGKDFRLDRTKMKILKFIVSITIFYISFFLILVEIAPAGIGF